VIVDFINGDPDYPIIIGRVYNAANMPPWKLPENATQMGIYSRSTPDGDYRKGNVLMFEDKMGREEVYIHAQRDRTEITRRNRVETVGKSKSSLVRDNFLSETGNDRSDLIHGNYSVTVGGGFPNILSDYLSSDIVKKYSDILNAAPRFSFDKGNYYLSSSGSITTNATISSTDFAGGMKTVSAGTVLNLTSGTTISVLTTGKILIACGESELIMNGNGDVEINGINLKVNMQDTISLKGGKIELN